MEKINIEFQHFEGCPNGPLLLKNILDAISILNIKIDFKEILIENQEDAIKFKFRGSPTLLINNIDFENLKEPENPNLSCRFYPNGIPNTELIISKISKLL